MIRMNVFVYFIKIVYIIIKNNVYCNILKIIFRFLFRILLTSNQFFSIKGNMMYVYMHLVAFNAKEDSFVFLLFLSSFFSFILSFSVCWDEIGFLCQSAKPWGWEREREKLYSFLLGQDTTTSINPIGQETSIRLYGWLLLLQQPAHPFSPCAFLPTNDDDDGGGGDTLSSLILSIVIEHSAIPGSLIQWVVVSLIWNSFRRYHISGIPLLARKTQKKRKNTSHSSFFFSQFLISKSIFYHSTFQVSYLRFSS